MKKAFRKTTLQRSMRVFCAAACSISSGVSRRKNMFHQTSRPRARIRLWRLWTLRRMGANPLN
jgi:hypothetical protein